MTTMPTAGAFAHPDIPRDGQVGLAIHSLDTDVSNLEELASEGAEFCSGDILAVRRLAESLQILALEMERV